jgi:3-dehydroquinate synthase
LKRPAITVHGNQEHHSYEVLFGGADHNSLKSAIAGARKVAIVAPTELTHLASELAERLNQQTHVITILVSEGEEQKSLSQVGKCWERLGAEGFRRDDAIIAIGGGATTDLGGFVAATWLRGIKWAAVPTSLAGMVDAAVGGKTGINTPAGKNLVGSFYSPSVVVVDFTYLQTLPLAEMRAGLAEVIKCGFIADQRILEIIESRDDFLDPKSETLHELIARAIAVKAEVVSEDLRESFLRESLNYGHTLAHAIERHEGYRWRHGDAVSVGLAFIASLTLETGIGSNALFERHISILNRVELPTSYPANAWKALLEGMQNDKKARSSGLRFVAVNERYEVVRLEGVSDDVLQRAYERIAT